MERKAEQATLPTAAEAAGKAGHGEEGPREEAMVLDHPNRAALLDDEEAIRAITGIHDTDWRRQAAGDELQVHLSGAQRR